MRDISVEVWVGVFQLGTGLGRVTSVGLGFG